MKPVPLGAAPTGAPYSPVVRFGPLLFVSGHFGTSDAFARRIQDARARGVPLPTMADLPFDEQVHQTMKNLKTTLESAGEKSGASRTRSAKIAPAACRSAGAA